MDITFISAFILGVIEGVTEFLPISSTFHMLMAEQLLGIQQTEFVKLFTVFIQAGAILAVLLLYAKDLWQDKTLALKACIAFIPTAIVGLTLYDFIKNVLFASPVLSICIFITVGVAFIILEKMVKNKSLQLIKVEKDITYKQALLIGFAQAAAVIPGVSRSGAVMIAMMGMKYTRSESARFSFILSIPTIFAAAALDLLESKDALVSNQDHVILLVVGFITAFIAALIIVKWFISYLQRNTLELFGLYRIIFGIILLFALFS